MGLISENQTEWNNNHSSLDTERMSTDEGDEDSSFYIYENPYARAGLVTIYSLVFILCFIGNLTVVLVVTLHWRMRSVTKFCLGNLAFANLCVGIFCIYQNLSMYLIDSWMFGDFLCKMYHFTNSLSYTASILILVVISVERYLVVLHPFRSRRLLTVSKLKWTIGGVWVLSGLVSAPRIYYIVTIQNPVMVGDEYEVICTILSSMFDNHTADLALFILLFLLPLLIISVLYTKVGWFLHKRAMAGDSFVSASFIRNQLKRKKKKNKQNNIISNNSSNNTHPPNNGMMMMMSSQPNNNKKKGTTTTTTTSAIILQLEPNPIPDSTSSPSSSSDNNSLSNSNSSSRHVTGSLRLNIQEEIMVERGNNGSTATTTTTGLPCTQHESIINNRSGSITTTTSQPAPPAHHPPHHPLHEPSTVVVSRPHRLLIIIVITFAICNLPFHVRKLYQNYVPDSDFESDLSEFLTQLTFIFRYSNCAINPILFAFMSQSFRSSIVDLLKCRFTRRGGTTKAICNNSTTTHQDVRRPETS